MFKSFFILSIFVLSLSANNIINYTQGLEYYKNKEYEKAFPIIQKEANKGNKEAQYLLASFYEKGLGVEQNIQNSLYWYKQASSTYQYITKTTHTPKEQKVDITESQDDSENNQHGLQFMYSKLDLSSENVKNEVEKIVNKDFGLMPYHTNYILPLSYSTQNYTKHYSSVYNPTEKYDNNLESEFQLSLQKNLSYDLFGFNEYITLGYTQHVWWQLYADSAPFRETNYTPEIFVSIPTSYEFDQLSNLKAVRFGYRHQSNGQDGYRSRSWDRLFLATFWQWDNLFVKAEGWYRLPEKAKKAGFYDGSNINDMGDDNPDIHKYLGYGDIELKYLYDSQQFGLKLRNNLSKNNKGSIEFDWSMPVRNSQNTYWYIKAFNGYGESLIDYNKNTTKISFGFAFFRDLF